MFPTSTKIEPVDIAVPEHTVKQCKLHTGDGACAHSYDRPATGNIYPSKSSGIGQKHDKLSKNRDEKIQILSLF